MISNKSCLDRTSRMINGWTMQCYGLLAAMLLLSGCATTVGTRRFTVSDEAMRRDGLGKDAKATTVSVQFFSMDAETSPAQMNDSSNPEADESDLRMSDSGRRKSLGQILFPVCEIGGAYFEFEDQRPLVGSDWHHVYQSGNTSYGYAVDSSDSSDVVGLGGFGQVGYRLDLLGCFEKVPPSVKVFVDLSIGWLGLLAERSAGSDGEYRDSRGMTYQLTESDTVDVRGGAYIQPRVELGLLLGDGVYVGVSGSYENYFSGDLESDGLSIAASFGCLW